MLAHIRMTARKTRIIVALEIVAILNEIMLYSPGALLQMRGKNVRSNHDV